MGHVLDSFKVFLALPRHSANANNQIRKNLALRSYDLSLAQRYHVWCTFIYTYIFKPGDHSFAATGAHKRNLAYVNTVDIALRNYTFHPVNPFSCH